MILDNKLNFVNTKVGWYPQPKGYDPLPQQRG